MHGLSLVVASRGYPSLQCMGFSLRWLLLLRSTGSRHVRFSSCGMRAQELWLVGSRVQAQQLWSVGLVAPRHVGSSRTRDRTHVSCIGRQILNHRASREVPLLWFCSQWISCTGLPVPDTAWVKVFFIRTTTGLKDVQLRRVSHLAQSTSVLFIPFYQVCSISPR